MNHYESLNVAPSATPREITSGYRRLLSTESLSDDQFAVIENAYRTLSDSMLRQAYDEELNSDSAAPKPPNKPHPINRPILVRKQAETELLVATNTPPPLPTANGDTTTNDSPPRPVPASPQLDNLAGLVQERPLAPRRSRRRRGRRVNTIPWRNLISCVAAALAAAPFAILILKFVFDKDPLNLWEQPHRPATVKRPVDPENKHVPLLSLATEDTNTSNNKPNSNDLNNPPQPKIPVPQTESTPAPVLNIPTPLIGPTAPKRTVRMPVPTPDELANPLRDLQDNFEDRYAEAKVSTNAEAQNVALIELGKELFTNGKLVQTLDASGAIITNNCIERYAWYQVALKITVESGDEQQVEQICESISSEYQIDNYELTNKITITRFENVLARSKGTMRASQFLSEWKLLFQESLTNSLISIEAGNETTATTQLELTRRILEQLKPELYLDPSVQTQLNAILAQMFDECLSTSKQHIYNLHFELALNVLQIAKHIATIGQGANEKSIADKLIAKNTRLRDLQTSFEEAKLKIDKSPDVPSLNSAIANYTILILNKWDDGLFLLARGQDATLAKIAKTDNQATAAASERKAPVNLSDEIKLAKQWQQLYNPNDRDINRREIILGRTKYWFEQTIPDLTPLQRLEVDKLLQDLSKGFE